jgi:Zn-dependent peptidase ImmA (M78 family)
MEKNLRVIYKEFDGKLIGTKKTKLYICETVLLLPQNIINYVTKTCWFFSSMDDAWAYTFSGNDLKNQHLIFLSDQLLSQTHEQILYSIAHEIGHVWLKHRNSIQIQQSKKEIRMQEKEADLFAKKFISS